VDFEEWRKGNHVFSEMGGANRHDLTLTGHGDPSLVDTVVVTPGMFSILDAKPMEGRTFLPDDGESGAAPVVVLSENFWRSRLGADRNIIGQSITLDQKSFTVVGIMPASFRVPIFTENQDVWIPLPQDPLFGPWRARRGGHWWPVVARLKPGVSQWQAQAEMDAFAARQAKEFPAEDGGWIIHVNPLQKVLVSDAKSALLVLLGAVGLVLLIACVNIANLLLSRAASRANEMALRLALGAPRGRIIRQLLTESGVLGLLGAIAGIAFAYWSVHALSSFLPADLVLAQKIRLDGWVLAFALIVSAAASFGFGLAPAFLTANSKVQDALKTGAARSGEGRSRNRMRNILAAAEIALALMLVVASGLLLRSFVTLTAVNPGFNVDHVMRAEVSLPQFQYATKQQWAAFGDALLERLQAQPGLQDSAIAVPLPLADGFVNLGFTIPGHAPLPSGTPSSTDYVAASPSYFHVLGIPLLRGRIFTAQDAMSSPRVAVISEALAHFYFPNEDPIGKQVSISFPPAKPIAREIVGIVGDIHDEALNKEPGPMVYVPFAQEPFWGGSVVVRTSLSTSSVVASIRQSVKSIDPNLPVTDVASMSDVLASSVAQPRFRAWLIGLFGIVALLLATAGIFGVISYSVSCRTREFGVRVALGASPYSIRTMVLREGLKLAAIGLCVGGIGALALARFLKNQLYGIGAHDPITFVAAAAILIVVALFASYIPARRATRVDPMVALRYE
jgi:putative ABC transport system permease protein